MEKRELMKYKVGDHLKYPERDDFVFKVIEIDRGTMRTCYIFEMIGENYTLDFAVDFVDKWFVKLIEYDSPLYKAMQEDDDE